MATRISQEQLNKFINPEAAMAPYERAEKQRAQQSQQDAALAQLIRGQELKDESAIAERQRNMADAQGLRKLLGKDARVSVGDVTLDPREQKPQEIKLTPFQKTLDESRARDISEDISKGGSVRRASDISTLKGVESSLGSKKNISGPIIGSIPMWARSAILPESAKAQQDFEAIAQRTLKETLGGQFAQKEGEEFFKRAYDPRLPEKVLQRRVAKARQVAEMLNQERQREIDYANRTGSLVGYSGLDAETAANVFNQALAEFDQEEADNTPSPQASQPPGGDDPEPPTGTPEHKAWFQRQRAAGKL